MDNKSKLVSYQYCTKRPWPEIKKAGAVVIKERENPDYENWICHLYSETWKTYDPFCCHFKHVTVKTLGQSTSCFPETNQKLLSAFVSW